MRRAPAIGSSAGSTSTHFSMRIGQRGQNGQPDGRWTSDGGLPSIGVSGCRRPTSSRGIEPSRPSVYGIRGR